MSRLLDSGKPSSPQSQGQVGSNLGSEPTGDTVGSRPGSTGTTTQEGQTGAPGNREGSKHPQNPPRLHLGAAGELGTPRACWVVGRAEGAWAASWVARPEKPKSSLEGSPGSRGGAQRNCPHANARDRASSFILMVGSPARLTARTARGGSLELTARLQAASEIRAGCRRPAAFAGPAAARWPARGWPCRLD